MGWGTIKRGPNGEGASPTTTGRNRLVVWSCGVPASCASNDGYGAPKYLALSDVQCVMICSLLAERRFVPVCNTFRGGNTGKLPSFNTLQVTGKFGCTNADPIASE